MTERFSIGFFPAALVAVAVAGAFAPAQAADKATAQTLIDREAAFAQAAIDHGTRAAFLEFLAESAVIMGPGPMPGRSTILSGPSPGGPLRWRADLATMSRQGDFGWASGPFTQWARTTNDRPEQSGHYFTVWWIEDDHEWRVILDGGAPYPVAETDLPHHLEVTPRLRNSKGTGNLSKDCTLDFVAEWRDKGRAKALKSYLAKDARLLYAGAPPRDGKGIVPAADPLAKAHISTAHVARRMGSEFGDVTVAYGDFELEATLEVPARNFVFIQAWDVSSKCELAFEALNPAR